MKKRYSTVQYKDKNRRRQKSLSKKRIKDKKRAKPYLRGIHVTTNMIPSRNIIRPIIHAPEDFRFVENSTDCLTFFKKIRNNENQSFIRGRRIIRICLQNVKKIDYATVSTLLAIIADLSCKGVHLNGDFPLDSDCKKLMIESGFLNQMYDAKGKPFKKQEKSETIVFEKGEGQLSEKDNIRLSKTIKHVVSYLTGEEKQCLPIKSLILEICGNSIEHAKTINRQWLLGVKYEEKRVLFSVTDVGKGILDTLHKKFKLKLFDTVSLKSNLDVLKGAFDKKYGSTTQEVNRNKGLPSIKYNSEKGVLINLIVITNNVTLHFNNDTLSRTLEKGWPHFKGTIYQWELTKESISKATVNYD